VRAGVRLAVDVGTVRIGVARSDATGALAVPLDAVRAGASSVEDVAALVREWEAIEVIVGLPLSMSGAEGKAAAAARGWAATLAERIEVPVRLVDERLSTVQAQRALQAGGRSTRQSRSLIDSASAVMVLQADLDREAAQGTMSDADPRSGEGTSA
jgi:putative Holliday junction resolvase